jgi:tetratricopeptide (TPR) repeat protein
MAKVYVSSTIADLKPERQAVLDWLRAARHQAIDSYLPDSDTLRESCLDDVGTCDLYLLILGHRYGFVSADDNPGGLSITQMEFRRAGECGIPRIALLRTSIPDERLSDVQDPAKLALVMAFRAEVAREVRPAEFSDVGALIQGLSTGVQAALAKLAPQPEGPAAAGPVLRLAPRPVFLAGREELLAELSARLTRDEGTGPRVVALCGLGGAGKTSVALEYAHRHLGEAKLAWQFPAEDPTVLAAAFGELATQLGTGEDGDPVVSVHGALAARQAGWLLVFDNAPDRASVAPFVPPAGRGQVLITSRDQIWPPGQALDVPVLDPEIAAQFLVDRTGDQDREAALELAGELGGLPLALEQAAAFMQASGRNIADYLGLFRESRSELLARGQVHGYDKKVATTWSVAFDQLHETCPGAVVLLRLLAWYAPEQIPVRLLLKPGNSLPASVDAEVGDQLRSLLASPLAVDDALMALRQYSLVSTPNLLSNPNYGMVSVHRLVQAVTADHLPTGQRDAWWRAAGALVEDVLPNDPNEPSAWPIYAVLFSHARAALPAGSAGVAGLTRYLLATGDFRTARVIGELVLESRRHLLGEKNRETLRAMNDLGLTLRFLGELESAHELLQQVVEGCRHLLGDEASDTLNARQGLGWVLRDLGHWDEAEAEFRTVLRLQTKQFGDRHPECLTTRRGLASVLRRRGWLAPAEAEYRAVLDARRHVLGEDHPDTLQSRHDLAYVLRQTGQLQAAEAEYRMVHEMQRQLLGEEHPATLITRHNLAVFLQDRDRWDEAGNEFRAVLDARRRVLGDRHPETLTTRHSLAYMLQVGGEHAAAESEYRAIIGLQRQVLGEENPATLATRNNLAFVLQDQGRWGEAEDEFRAVLDARRRVLGEDHRETLDTWHALAYVRQASS